MIVVAPLVVTSTTSSIMALVPLENFSHSNTPAGPFQTMTLALRMGSLKASTVFGPMSKPIHSSGIPSSTVVEPD